MNYEELLIEYKNEETLLKSSLEFKKGQKEELIDEMYRTENLFKQGLIGVKKYAELRKNFLGGIPKEELLKHYKKIIEDDARKLVELRQKIKRVEKRIELRDKLFR